MISFKPIATERLLINDLAPHHVSFIRQLVNTEGWITFIGDRHVHSDADALAYIQKILANEKLQYWVATLKDTGEPVGVVTLIKRDYLDHHDIGFAFLPHVAGNGYAHEATSAMVAEICRHSQFTHLLATTFPGNNNSIKLLKKLGLEFNKEIITEGLNLHVYSMDLSAD